MYIDEGPNASQGVDLMDDGAIVELYWARAEAAISETKSKYAGYCFHISYNILRCNEDAEECVNDTYLNAWNAMPPHRPNRLSTFLGKITRNLSLQRYIKYNAQKRGMGQVDVALDELDECIPSRANVEQFAEEAAISRALEDFLRALPKEARVIFVARYWYVYSIKEISAQYGVSESKVEAILFRTRKKLKSYIEGEGFTL